LGDPRSVEADLALAAACAAGDAKAWERLVVVHGPVVAGAVRAALARSGLRDRGLEEELVGDTFATVSADSARALRAFEGKASLGTFLSVIAARVVGRAVRRRGIEAKARRVLGDRVARAGEAGEEASAQAERNERSAVVAAGMAELRPRDRLLLSLFYDQGRSYKEIAAIVGIAATGVGAEIARARARLGERLEARGIGGEVES
jgi:RNA polymerase sigma factor (sigma-70 family)